MSAPIILLSESAKEPDMFHGKSVESHDYLVHFECESLELNGQLLMSLRGLAQGLLSELRSDQLHNYAYVVEVLYRRYCPVERETAFLL